MARKSLAPWVRHRDLLALGLLGEVPFELVGALLKAERASELALEVGEEGGKAKGAELPSHNLD